MLPSHLTSCFQARHWKKYAEVEITAGNTQQVKTIFSRCLLSCPSVDLWQTYLTFIQKVISASNIISHEIVHTLLRHPPSSVMCMSSHASCCHPKFMHSAWTMLQTAAWVPRQQGQMLQALTESCVQHARMHSMTAISGIA